MTFLSREQVYFLKSQGISPAQIFDATSVNNKSERIIQMDFLELYFYIGNSPCQKSGHLLRTKAGHCIQCDHSKIAYQLRSSAAGYVYLAYSKSNSLAKIGFTKNMPTERVFFLAKECYANSDDWVLHKYVRFEKEAGKKEFEIHSILEKHLLPVKYEKTKGKVVLCREVFSCTLELALNAFNKITNK